MKLKEVLAIDYVKRRGQEDPYEEDVSEKKAYLAGFEAAKHLCVGVSRIYEPEALNWREIMNIAEEEV